MDIKRAYRFRFYPTSEQEVILARTFGCTRFVYNHMLRQRTEAWHQRRERMGYHATHQLSTRLIHENHVIAIESLSVRNLQKNRCLAKSIGDTGWSEFTRQLAYKAQWYGRTLVSIDRWYLSSKRCSACGHTVAQLVLKIRTWACPECGSIHDRDINAARNILAAGLPVSAQGEAVSPVSL